MEDHAAMTQPLDEANDLPPFTAGPWYVSDDPAVVETSNPDKFIHTIGPDASHADGEDYANAVLVAAAPCMFYALRAVAADATCMAGFDENFRAQIHAVIAKATEGAA